MMRTLGNYDRGDSAIIAVIALRMSDNHMEGLGSRESVLAQTRHHGEVILLHSSRFPSEIWDIRYCGVNIALDV